MGFNLQNMVYPSEWLEVRGVQFKNTAFRELYYSAKVKEILEPHGFLVISPNFNYFNRWEMSRTDFGITHLRFLTQKMPAL